MSRQKSFGASGKCRPEDIVHVWDTVKVPLGQRSYEIQIGPGLLTELPARLREIGIAQRLFIVTDSNVEDLIGIDLLNILEDADFEATLISFPAGEESKHMETVIGLARRLVQLGADRRSLILALGGGVTGDIAGFLASIYMRGIPFIQLPTTLLAQVDSSVGGKTGVDLPEGKNLIGTFAQPLAVFADIGVLASLPGSEVRNGLAEIVKYGMIADPELFKFLEEKWWDVVNLEPETTSFLVRRSCEIKADVVSRDEREGGLRRILNFGHTIGHAVEAVSGYSIPHGEAVAIGMVAVSKISVARGLMAQEDLARLKGVLEQFRLPVEIPGSMDRQSIMEHMKRDKKVQDGRIHFVLTRGIGVALVVGDVSKEELERAMQS